MLIYVITLFIVVLATYLARKSKSTIMGRFFIFVVFATMVFVAGLRDKSVGTDTGNYVRKFAEIQTFGDVLSIGNRTGEYGYVALSWIINFIFDGYYALLLVIAMIVVGCYQRAILSHSENIVISFFVFITMGFYTFFFNGARQGISCAICALAIGPLMDRNFRKYIFLIIIATIFHKSALVMIPVYFFLKEKNTLKTNIIYIFIGIASALSLQKVVDIMSEYDSRYESYATSGEGGGYYMVAFTCILTLFFLLFKKFVQIDRERYVLFLNMLIFGAIISVISAFLKINPSGILRFTLYFNVSVIFLWPIVYKNLANRSTRILFNYFFAVGYLVFFVLTTERFSKLIPYTFNQELPFF